MKAQALKDIKKELGYRSEKELLELCLRLAKFKKENKELLTYLLFEKDNEAGYIHSVKNEIDEQLSNINRRNYYLIRKGLRKTLTQIRKYIRFSQNKETEVELLLYFCQQLKSFSPSIQRSIRLKKMYATLIASIRTKIGALHEDLQYDYGEELKEL